MTRGRQSTSRKIPDGVKLTVTTQAEALIAEVLKPKFVHPPPDEPRWNYIVDVHGKWQGNSFTIFMKYHCPNPNATSPEFDAKFARIEYAGVGPRFHLSFMRHTGQWVRIYSGLPLDECLVSIVDDPFFQM
jgi:hypothetical protein